MTASEDIALEQDWVLRRQRAVAWLRVAFAIVAIVVIRLNPSRVAHFPVLSNFTLGTFFIYSAFTLFLVNKTQRGAMLVGAVTTSLDVIWIAVIVYSTGGTRTPFFFYYSFPVITAAVRWGIKGSFPVALIGVGTYLYVRLTLTAEAVSDPLGIDSIIVRSFYLVVLALIFGYVSEFERKQNQKLLILSKTAAQAAVVHERRRIMLELHDGVLQSLATFILRLESCRGRLLDSQTEIAQELESAEELSRSTMHDIRDFLAGKMTNPLPSGTLIEKLREELSFLRDGLGLEVVLECTPENIDLPHKTEREIFYVLREALINVTRHSHASRASIHLRQDRNHLAGVLIDDGIGFEQGQKSAKVGFGLSGMAERIKQLGGELLIESSPGAGTKISFVVSLAS